MAKDLRVIKNTGDCSFAIVHAEDIEEVNYSETYSEYGQRISHYDAGDWTFGNPDFEKELEEAIRENFVDITEENEIRFEDEDVLVDWEKHEEATKFAKEYNEENAVYATCTVINYWDGHNHRTIVLDDDYGTNLLWRFASEEEEEKILSQYETAEFGEYEGGVAIAETEDYTFSISLFPSYAVATVEKNF